MPREKKMSSKQMAETTEKTPDVTQLSSIVEKLARVGCPFTWGKEFKDKCYLNYPIHYILDTKDYFPEMVLMYLLLKVFFLAGPDEVQDAMEYMDDAEECLAEIKEKATLKNVETVLDHIFIGTKCHVLKLQGRLAEVDELLGGIVAVCDMNKLELAMLSGCKCSTWTIYDIDDGVGITWAKEAIELDPNNGKWYFLLGLNHSKSRKVRHSMAQVPDNEETSAFEKAYALSPNVFFGVSLAQLYRESGDFEMANKIYKEVHALQPTSCTVRLQLALGFIRAHEGELAKECLDYVAEKDYTPPRYDHYMGLYEEKCNRNFEAALPHYKSSAERLNLVAESHYVNCRRKVEPDWDPLPYMLSLLEKYGKFSDCNIQEVNIHIGSYYLFELQDIPAACKYLRDAITFEPNSKRLEKHWVASRKIKVNLYQVLANEVQTVLRDDAAKHDDDTMALLKDTQRLCSINCKYMPPQRTLTISGSSSSHPPRSYQNRGRGFSSYPETSGRTERPRPSSSQWRSDFPRDNEHRSANNFWDGSRRGRDASPIVSWRSRDKKDENVEDTTCELVKNVKDLRM